MNSPLLAVENLSKRFGGFMALTSVNLTVQTGERLGIIGPNGSGKTTLINCIAGTLRNDTGTVRFSDNDITRLPAHRRGRLGISRSFQIPRPFSSMTVAENVAVPLEFVVHRHSLHTADVRAEALQILERVRLSHKADIQAGTLTQIELRKLELARAAAIRPRLQILDEVMAGLSSHEVDEVLELVLELAGQGVTIVMIEHIMQAIMRFSRRVVCLDAGRIVADAAPEDIVKDPNVQRIYLGA
jgi:branched-chain amino acid transport system ATP-binding protein